MPFEAGWCLPSMEKQSRLAKNRSPLCGAPRAAQGVSGFVSFLIRFQHVSGILFQVVLVPKSGIFWVGGSYIRLISGAMVCKLHRCVGMSENCIMQDLPTFDGIAAPADGAQMDSHASHVASLIPLKPLTNYWWCDMMLHAAHIFSIFAPPASVHPQLKQNLWSERVESTI